MTVKKVSVLVAARHVKPSPSFGIEKMHDGENNA
jgi:hypothetical protein